MPLWPRFFDPPYASASVLVSKVRTKAWEEYLWPLASICRQLNEPGCFSGSLPPLLLPVCYCIYFYANKYDDEAKSRPLETGVGCSRDRRLWSRDGILYIVDHKMRSRGNNIVDVYIRCSQPDSGRADALSAVEDAEAAVAGWLVGC